MTDHQPGCGCTRCDQRRQCDAEFPVRDVAPTGGVSFGQGYTYSDESGIKRFTAASTSSFLSELMPLIGQKPKRLMAIPEIDMGTMYLFEPGPDSALVYEVIGSERLRGLNEPMVIISRRLRDQLACLGYSDAEISRAVESLIRKQNGAKP